ncbi:MAG: DUF599 domain-containing protein [Betaproteobacteria bacterium]|nr:DUF599 domain-containing protein [Betaproteobacteria bacterium]
MSGMDPWLREFGADAAAFAASALLVAAYYVALLARSRRDPTSSIHGVNELARGLWVKHVMSNPSKDIMAVQTLRNFIMGATLMATTAAFLILGTLSLTGQAENIGRSWHVSNLYGSSSPELWIVKVMCLLAVFIVAFFAFAMAIRLANHVVFMVNVTAPGSHPALSPEGVAVRLNSAGRNFATGMRAFFFAVPLVFWLFGPLFLVVATAGLVIALHRIDRIASV